MTCVISIHLHRQLQKIFDNCTKSYFTSLKRVSEKCKDKKLNFKFFLFYFSKLDTRTKGNTNMNSVFMDVLSEDSLYRKQNYWPLIPESEFENYITSEELPFLSATGNYYHPKSCNNRWYFNKEVFFARFPAIPIILDTFPNNVCIAGGFYTNDPNTDICIDVDIFVYGCDKNVADMIIKQACQIITIKDLHPIKKSPVRRQLFPDPAEEKEQENAPIWFQKGKNVINAITFDGNRYTKYQFIFRLYPTLNSIVGGFDIGASAVLMKHDGIFATPLGAFSLVNEMIIVDISRRSTTFAKRLNKYMLRGFKIVFPGFSKDVDFFSDSQKKHKEFVEKTREMMEEFQIIFKAYNGFDCYDGNFSSRISVEDAFEVKNEIDLLDFKIGVSNELSVQTKEKDLSDYGDSTEFCIESSNFSALINDKTERCFATHEFVFGNDMSFDEHWNKIIFDVNIPVYEYGFLTNAKEFYYGWYGDNVRMIRAYGIFSEQVHEWKKQRRGKRYQKFHGDREKVVEEVQAKIISFLEEKKKEAREQIKGIEWTTENPGRQWTSSFNPEIVKATDFYGDKFYTPVYTFITPEVETLLRLARRQNGNVWSLVSRDVFNLIIAQIPFVKVM